MVQLQLKLLFTFYIWYKIKRHYYDPFTNFKGIDHLTCLLLLWKHSKDYWKTQQDQTGFDMAIFASSWLKLLYY